MRGVSNVGDDSREYSTKLTSRSVSLVLTLLLIWTFPDLVVFQRNGFRDRWRSASSSGDVLCNWTSCSTSAASMVRDDVYRIMAGFERRTARRGGIMAAALVCLGSSTEHYRSTKRPRKVETLPLLNNGACGRFACVASIQTGGSCQHRRG